MSWLMKARRGESLLAATLLIGPFLLAIPGPLGSLNQAFTAIELTGAGLILLATLPAAWLMAIHREHRPTLAPLLACTLWFIAELSAIIHPSTETLERDRALLLLITGVVLCFAATKLRAAGHAVLGKLLCLLTLLLLLPPLVEAALGASRLFLSGGAPSDAIATLAGVLGNPGELSNAALPGALFGVMLTARGRGVWRIIGASAALSTLFHAAFAPALTTLAATVLIGLATSVSSRASGMPSGRVRTPLSFALIALALLGGRLGLQALPSGPSAPAEKAQATLGTQSNGDLGGLAVRKLIAQSSFEALRSLPGPFSSSRNPNEAELLSAGAGQLLGYGPGQFVNAYPSFRTPEEIALSSHNRTINAETEVEHPHSDLLLALVELGWLGGACFLLILLHALSCIRSALSRGDDSEAGLAMGLAGLLIASFLHAPLLHHPLTSALAFITLGALSSPTSASPLKGARWFGVALAILLTSHAQRALAIARHGDELSLLSHSLTWEEQNEVVDHMLAACPDSVIALNRRARLLGHPSASTASTAERLDAWDAVRALRPYRIEPLIQTGILHARNGRLRAASQAFNHALSIDSEHPGALRNLARVELLSSRTTAGIELLEKLTLIGQEDKLWRLRLGTDLLLEGMMEEAVQVLDRCQLRFRNLDAERCWQLAREYRSNGGDAVQSHIADAFECTAHRLWARRHAEALDWDSARRSFRQAQRLARHEDLSSPPRFELEFAAILWNCKMPIDARDAFQSAGDDATAWRNLPSWAGDALLKLQRSEAKD
jgi:tetratricopeptide (TPR) repeat protein